MRRLSLLFFISIFLVSCGVLQPQPQTQKQTCYLQQGFCIDGEILSFWLSNGGEKEFGEPVSPQWGNYQWFSKGKIELSEQGPVWIPGDFRFTLSAIARSNFPGVPEAVEYTFFGTGEGAVGWYVVNLTGVSWASGTPVDVNAIKQYVKLLESQASFIADKTGIEVVSSPNIRHIIYLFPAEHPVGVNPKGDYAWGLTSTVTGAPPESRVSFVSAPEDTIPYWEFTLGTELCQQILIAPNMDQQEGICNTIGRMHLTAATGISSQCPEVVVPDTGNQLRCYFDELQELSKNKGFSAHLSK